MMKPISLFNSSSSFSQQQPGFGSTAPTPTIFGNQQQKPFGFSTPSTVTSAFGSPAFSTNQPSAVPTFGGGGSHFGAQTTTTSSPGFTNFAAPSLSISISTAGGFSGFNLGGNTGLGGGFSFAGSNALQPGTHHFVFFSQAQGTSIPFNAITGTDTMMNNSVQSSINTRHQCITCMKEYEQKSLDELRLEDYQLGRQPNSLFRSTQAQPIGLFSSLAPATNTTSTFGQQQRPPPFGATTTQSSGGGLFPNINLPKPNFFGSIPTSTGFADPTSNTFSFNSSQPQSLFQTTQPATTGTMCNQGGFGFTRPTQQQSFGLNAFKPMVAPVATSTPFGGTQTNPAMSTNLFTSTPSFNQQPNFGTTAPTSSIFAMQSEKPFGFNTPATISSAFGPQTFSTNPTQTVAPFGTSGSIFGPQTTTTASTGFPNFAALSLPTSTAGGFSGFNLGGNTSLGGGSTGFNTGTNTFGPSTSLKQFTYPVLKTPVFKTNSLFDGFEDDDRGPVIDILSKTSDKNT